MKTHFSTIALPAVFLGMVGLSNLAYADEYNLIEERIECTAGVAKTYQVKQNYETNTHVEFTIGLECDNLTFDLNGKQIKDGNVRVLNGTKVVLEDSVGGGYLYNLARTDYADRDEFITDSSRYEEGEPLSPNPQVEIKSGIYSGNSYLNHVILSGGTYSNVVFRYSASYSNDENGNYFFITDGSYNNITFRSYIDGALDISGGTFNNITFEREEGEGSNNINISGGIFNGLTYGEGNTFFITGGSFDVSPNTDYIPEGYVISEENGRFVVRQKLIFNSVNTVLPLDADDETKSFPVYGDEEWASGLTFASSDETILKINRLANVGSWWKLIPLKEGKATISYSYANGAYTGSFEVNVVKAFDVSEFSEKEQLTASRYLAYNLSCAKDPTFKACEGNDVQKIDKVLAAVLDGKTIKMNAPKFETIDEASKEAEAKAAELGLGIFAKYKATNKVLIIDPETGKELGSGTYYNTFWTELSLPKYLADQKISVIHDYLLDDVKQTVLDEYPYTAEKDKLVLSVYVPGEANYYLAADEALLPSLAVPDTGSITSNFEYVVEMVCYGLGSTVIIAFTIRYLAKRIDSYKKVQF